MHESLTPDRPQNWGVRWATKWADEKFTPEREPYAPLQDCAAEWRLPHLPSRSQALGDEMGDQRQARRHHRWVPQLII